MKIYPHKLSLSLILVGLLTFPVYAASIHERLEPCLACHGEKGQSESPDVPSLGAQPPNATLIQLYLFREKRRNHEVMIERSKDLTDTDLQIISDILARLPPPKPAEQKPDDGRMHRGREVSHKNRCGFCHNPDYSGRDNIPRLAAQQEEYLVKAMREYKSGERKGYDAQMAEVLYAMNDTEIRDVAYFLANLAAETPDKKKVPQ